MKLYAQNGKWVGTQADAKREFGITARDVDGCACDVPTDKQGLLDWLNENAIGKRPNTHEWDTTPIADKAPTPTGYCSANPTKWDIADAARVADMKHLTQAIAIWMTRLDDAL